ncbi:MAG: hypothetical protein QOC92_350 [Acidimicrobiaceae bacterium]
MIQLAVLAGTAFVAWVLLTAPVRANYVVLVSVLAFVPPVAGVPNGLTSQLFITRVLVIVAGLGLAIRVRRGEAIGARFGSHPVVILVVLALVVALVNGVVFVADPTNMPSAMGRWMLLVDQALTLLVVSALLRAIDDLVWATTVVVLAFSGAALLGLVERVTGVRPTGVIFGPLASILAAGPTVRGGFSRPRGTFQFAQEFGLILAFIAPLAVIWVTLRRRSLFALTGAALIVVVSLLTISRSAVLALGVGALVLVLFSRSGPIRALAISGAVLAALSTVVFAGWWAAFSGPDVTGSTDARIDRIPVVASLVADRPWTGVGLSGIEADVPSTDNQYLLTYAEVGAIGTVALGAMWAGVTIAVAFGLRGPSGPERSVVVGCLAGLIAGLVAAATIDLFTLGGSRVFWLLAALGLVAAERTAPPLPRAGRHRLTRPALAAAGTGLVLGGLLVVVFPRAAAREFVFTSWPALAEAVDLGSGFHIGAVYVNSVCEHSAALASSGAAFDCRGVKQSSGVGVLRIAAGTRTALDDAVHNEMAIGRVLSGFELLPVGPVRDALPNWVRTAPLWLAALLGFVLSVPRLRPLPRE